MGKQDEHFDVQFGFDSGTIPPSLRWSSPKIEGILDGEQLLAELRQAHVVDILTYSATILPGVRVRRYIVGTGKHGFRQDTILVRGTHAKLYIAYTIRDKPTAYIGSMNAVSPTLFELNVRLEPKQSKELAKYYNQLWKNNLPQ